MGIAIRNMLRRLCVSRGAGDGGSKRWQETLLENLSVLNDTYGFSDLSPRAADPSTQDRPLAPSSRSGHSRR